jgi:signal transduction histidine kinase/DNA-binding response OmpR family regulator
MKPLPATLAARFSRMDLFSTVPLAILEQLAEESAIEEFPADAVIFHKDEPGHALYLILQGGVKVHDGDYIVSKMAEGSSFGELALLDEGLRSMSVTTTQPTTLAVVEREALFRILRKEPDVLRKIVGSLAQRLRHQTYKLVEELRQREQELTRLVEERTAELNRQKEKAEAEKQEAEYQRQRAEQSEQFEQQFLANMSHEIRTPMNAVVGMTNILLQKNPREDQLRYLESIRDSSSTLLVILNDILDISKIQSGRMELEDTDMDLSQILSQVKTTLQYRAEEKGLLFKIESDPALPPVLVGDPVRLQQILLNLAGNAVKFTEKGSVTILARLLEVQGNNCRLHFEVRDTGIGMTPEQAARAFESFRQAATDTTRKYGGTGLGLSISKQLVELFGGTLEVQSKLGEGSSFSFDISLKISEKKALPTQKAVSSAQLEALGKLRILVAEDNHYNRIVAVETLELLLPDVRVSIAENGREALEKVKTEDFNLVLMDVNMPEMDGLEATRLIRALPAPKNTLPVIAFTASVTKAEIHKCEAAGMNTVVPKPFKDSELINAMYSVISPYSSDDFESSDESPPKTGLDFLESLTGGNPQRIRKYLGLYLESVQTSLPKIEAATIANDREALRRAVHALKPQFKIVGLTSAAELAETVERRLLDGMEPAALFFEIEMLLAEIRQSVGVFESRLKQMPEK